MFNGKIIVRQDAQKTNAKQTNKALLLSDDAQVNTKPQLEIFADDVKCTHGAAIGQLDEDALFYMQARGISYQDARNLMIHAFAGEVLDSVKEDVVRERACGSSKEVVAIGRCSARPRGSMSPRFAPTFRRWTSRSTGGPWSTSTTRRPRRSRDRSSTPSVATTRKTTPTSIAACTC